MNFRISLGLLLLLAICSCIQPSSKDEKQLKTNSGLELETGLTIEYKPTRGQSYIDSLGIKYQLRHIPTIITNDSTVPINMEIIFNRSYNYPSDSNNIEFKIFPMPKEWALDGIDISEDMINELASYIKNPSMSKTLEPGEEWLLALGTLYPTAIDCGIFPIAVFSGDYIDPHNKCRNLISLPKLNKLDLGLLLGVTRDSQASPDSCLVVPCGKFLPTKS